MKLNKLLLASFLSWMLCTGLLVTSSRGVVDTSKQTAAMENSFVLLLYVVIPLVFALAMTWGARRQGWAVSAGKVVLLCAGSIFINILAYLGTIVLGAVMMDASIANIYAVGLALAVTYFFSMLLFALLFLKLFGHISGIGRMLAVAGIFALLTGGGIYVIFGLTKQISVFYGFVVGSWQLIAGWQLQKLANASGTAPEPFLEAQLSTTEKQLS